ncbi:hypothetical protein HSR121_2040 [Halapricum desulfuricans]|uniref:Uncharacterized protein n=1 Tax=Halapricum desulfuricans TaxID=2841257 RepID=A0A897N0B8_9EURY|nr:hypothetical protein HSR121_2040 [Halapricum desulfuricans]
MGTFTPKTGICEEREVEALKQGILEPCHHGEYPPQEYIDRFDWD